LEGSAVTEGVVGAVVAVVAVGTDGLGGVVASAGGAPEPPMLRSQKAEPSLAEADADADDRPALLIATTKQAAASRLIIASQ
jgi:delta 1-pyrroline-5-carboxylate dehydrogenase